MIMVDELRLFPGARPPFHRGSCHLTTDGDLDELHAFALRIGLRREWFQALSHPHYDLTRPRRARALLLGAAEVSARRQAERRVEARRIRELLGARADGMTQRELLSVWPRERATAMRKGRG